MIVDAPCTTRRATKLRTAERIIPFGEMPQWWKKLSSSTAITAFCRSTGIFDSGSSARFSIDSSATRFAFTS